jgi:glycosyltransferase involved in cell wall biosynthesis
VWLTLAMLGDGLPTASRVRASLLRVQLDGPWSVLTPLLRRQVVPQISREASRSVVTDAVVIDLQHTSRTDLATGIQRVAREASRRWASSHSVMLVGWDGREKVLKAFEAEQSARALGGTAAEAVNTPGRAAGVVVPYRSTYILPELAVEPRRTERIQAMAQYSGCRTGVIGFDCVPITTAETVAAGMGGAFAGSLAAVRHMNRVAAISQGAADEYGGWRRMLHGSGETGPDIRAIPLPVQAAPTSEPATNEARARFVVPGLRLVLSVGSHEPRKNHLAVLHAAEVLWREGQRFSLTFIGGNSWNSEGFEDRLRALQQQGRPIQSVRSVPDPILWAAYRLAHVVLFPSLNEGFGLPVAEALACGTPVVTSRYGSMKEIAADGGALLVDPRDDVDLTGAMRAVLVDDGLHSELATQARRRPARTWDQYAEEVWTYLAHE